jgi:hypothetical protein
MAFTGTPVIKQVSDSMVRITGVTLAGSASGTIALAGHTGATPDIVLPESFKTLHYAYLGEDVPFVDAIHITVGQVAAIGDSIPISVAKAGTHVTDFRATLSNGFASVSAGLEIYVKFHQ